MTTKILVNSKDLSNIFAPYVSGTKASTTNFLVNNNDLSNIFAPYISGTKAENTNILVNNNDLSNIFSKKAKTTFNIGFTGLGAYPINTIYLNGKIYCTGRFTNVVYNGVSTVVSNGSSHIIVSWNPSTTTWTLIGTCNGTTQINTIYSSPSENSFYIGGSFSSINSLSMTRIAKYNTLTSTWSAFTNPFVNQIFKLERYGNIFYSLVQADGIGYYYNTSWNSIPGTLYSAANGTGTGTPQIFAINQSNGIYYMSGNFASANNGTQEQIYNYLLKYDPSTNKISPVPNSNSTLNGAAVGISGTAQAMIIINDILYVGANAYVSGGNTFFNAYNTITGVWSSPNSQFNAAVRSFYYYNNVLYIGGNFTTSTAGATRFIVAWDLANTWTPITVTTAITTYVTSITYDPNLGTVYTGVNAGIGITTG